MKALYCIPHSRLVYCFQCELTRSARFVSARLYSISSGGKKRKKKCNFPARFESGRMSVLKDAVVQDKSVRVESPGKCQSPVRKQMFGGVLFFGGKKMFSDVNPH